MIDVARSLTTELEQLQQGPINLQLIFFDGEEAFAEWTDTDSM
jgi:hypothetical protein